MFGATPAARGFRFHLWAPVARSVTLHLSRDAGSGHRGRISTFELEPRFENRDPASVSAAEGIWEIEVSDAAAGDRYAFSLDGRNPLPDPASRFQPDGVHAWSEIVDPRGFAWSDGSWRGLDPRRAVIYELHIGTFTDEGTFRGSIEKLPYLRDLGVTAIELMPVADFAGRRNWGYDGVALFAPSRAYGRPDDLRALVDAAHREELAVLVDVVYNHLGPEGAYLPSFSPAFLNPAHATPWGSAVNLDGPGSAIVRRLLVDNAVHWIHEYHADGLRLDATHSLIDGGTPHFVAELTAAVHAASHDRALVYAEDSRNLAIMVSDAPPDGWRLDGLWADDFHHVVRRMVAGDAHAYYRDFAGTAEELASIFRNGWLFTGQHSSHHQAPRGTDPSSIPLRKSIVCIQNHDQIGNRALGDRLNHSIEASVWRAATTVLLTAPMTPLLFMGQEWAASTPFVFFTDFEPGLGRLVIEGRRNEFAGFPEFSRAGAIEWIPSPQAEATFEASRLRWEERLRGSFASALALTRRLLSLRNACPSLQASDAPACDVEALGADALAFVRVADGCAHLVVARLRGAGAVEPRLWQGRRWTKALDTEDVAFTDDPEPAVIDAAAGRIAFRRPGAVIFAA